MSIYSAEDPEGRTTDTATWRDRDAEARDAEARDAEAHDATAAHRAHGEPSTANGGAGAADPDVIVLEEADLVVLDDEPRDSGSYAGAPAVDPGSPVSDQDREFPRADIAADTGPELTNAAARAPDPGRPTRVSQGPDPG